MLWLWDIKKDNRNSLTDPVDEWIDDTVDEWIDDTIDFLERTAKWILPWAVGILIGIALGYAWRVAQTGGL